MVYSFGPAVVFLWLFWKDFNCDEADFIGKTVMGNLG